MDGGVGGGVFSGKNNACDTRNLSHALTSPDTEQLSFTVTANTASSSHLLFLRPRISPEYMKCSALLDLIGKRELVGYYS
jgi:hypothetical protein